jgi:tetratricopeptide (TPR) repeat protein
MAAKDKSAKGHRSEVGGFNPDLSPAEFEVEFWGRVLERQPNYVDVLRRQAESLARAGRYHELVPLDFRLVELLPDDAVVHYNLACTLSRLGRATESLATLREAIRLGYDDFGQIETDPDLEAVRELPGFLTMLNSARRQRG